MGTKKQSGLFFYLSSFCLSLIVLGCTGFVTTKGDQILIGNNEDYFSSFTDTVVRIRPAGNGYYGRLMIGFNQQGFSMGGINDQGLFFDSFSVPDCLWTHSSSKEDFPGFTLDDMLGRCATVEDAITYCQRYNLQYFQNNQLFLVERSGKAAVISWGTDDIEVTWKTGEYQVVTNFFLQHPERGWYPCTRYQTVDSRLKEDPQWDFELFRRLLWSVHAEWNGGMTQYSNIVDLLKGDFYVFNHSNFEEYITFNLTDELGKGRIDHQIPQYMSSINSLSILEGDNPDPTIVTFSWTAREDSSYRLFCSKYPDFRDCTPIVVSQNHKNSSQRRWRVHILLSVIVMGSFALFKKERMVLLSISMICLVTLFAFCSKDEVEATPENRSSISQFSAQVENLDSDTIYYWRVEATIVPPYSSTSITKTFRTN